MTDPSRPHILLMGLRASGKSTLARTLAQRAGLAAIDLDIFTLNDLDAHTVEDAWQSHGEHAFRRAETRVLARCLATPAPTVIALGGGTPTAPGAADLLRDTRDANRAFLIYLRVPLDTLRSRLAATPDDPNRPSLTGTPAHDEIDIVFSQRDPLYSDLADLVLERAQSPAQDADDILRAWPSQ